jgi:hypothetical protein
MNAPNQQKEKLRAYRVEGHDYPSVTSVISYVFGMPEEMMNWVAKNSILRALREQRAGLKAGKKLTQKELVAIGSTERHRLLKEAQLKGTTVHTWAEKYYTNGENPQDIPKEYKGYWDSFQRFNEYFKLEPILQETVVYSHECRFAGRMDFYGTLTHQGQEKRVLVDFKTSNFLRSDYGLQLAAYKHCLESMGYPVDECYILHLCRHGFYEFVKYNDDIEDFVSVRRLFDWKRQREQPEFELALEPKEFIDKIKTAG